MRDLNSLPLGPLGLGVAPLGNLYTDVSEVDALGTLAAAAQHGIRWFDVAPVYGHGLAELRLGSFLRDSGGASAIVSTKVGRVLEPTTQVATHEHFVAPLPFRPMFDYSSAGIERSYDESLGRLGLDRVQLLLLHDTDRVTHPNGHRALVKQVLDEAIPTLQRLKAEKRVDAIGLGINEWDIGYEILASAQIDCVLLAGRYTLFDSTAHTSGFLDACLRRNVMVLAGGVFNSGFLAGGAHYDYRPANDLLLKRRDQLIGLCHRYGAAMPAVALQYSAAHPAVTSVVVGARSAPEVEAIMQWQHAKIPADLWDELRSAGFITGDAPTSHQRNGGNLHAAHG